MKMSLEIPLFDLAEFLPLTDFPFGLAHLCLPKYHPDYSYYRGMYKGCLLDNSMYELGDEPLSISELQEAAYACDARSVIAPDWMDNYEKTKRAAFEMMEKGIDIIGAVVQGKDIAERVLCFQEFQKAGFRPICFPFRTPRRELIQALQALRYLNDDNWYHLLGLHDLKELQVRAAGSWSYDTGKPFKGIRLDKGEIRGHGHLDLHQPLSDAARTIALWNIAYMRRLSQ